MEDAQKYFEESSNDIESDISVDDAEFNLEDVNKIVSNVEPSNVPKKSSKKRQPTRRPDPNVYNRNALLARENRRKKKAYLEAIEKELEGARTTISALMKRLKKETKLTRRLERETHYLKSIVANRSEISSLMSVLTTNFPYKRNQNGSLSLNQIVTPPENLLDLPLIPGSSQETISYDDCDNDFSITAFNDSWCEVIGNGCELNKDIDRQFSTSEENGPYSINNEHSYVTNYVIPN